MADDYLQMVLAFQENVMSDSKDDALPFKDGSFMERPNIGDLFDFIETHFDKLKTTTYLKPLLPILHHVVLEAERSGPDTAPDMGVYVGGLLKEHMEEDEPALLVVLQIIYQVLNTLHTVETFNTRFSQEVFFDLIDLLLRDQFSKTLNVNIITCVQLYVRKYVSQGGAKSVMDTLWVQLNLLQITPSTVQSMVHLFDDFLAHIKEFTQNPRFVSTIQMMLQSEESDVRKAGYFILKKLMLTGLIQHPSFRLTGPTTRFAQRNAWTTFVTIMENLEENQSHLILPSLDTITSIHGAGTPESDGWMQLLYMKILDHTNILVIRWAIEFFLGNFVVSQLNDIVLGGLLKASNNTRLFNYEAYFIPFDNIRPFIADDVTKFMEVLALSNINWKAVPLHFWLVQVGALRKPMLPPVLSLDGMLAVASRVRGMRNVELRRDAIVLFENIFRDAIGAMDLANYLLLLDTLYNVKDNYSHFNTLIEKLLRSTIQEIIGLTFTMRLYELLSESFTAKTLRFYCSLMLDRLRDVPKEAHGTLRFLIALDCFCDGDDSATLDDAELRAFCITKYDINHKALEHSTFAEIRAVLCGKLVFEHCQSGPEERLVQQRTIDYFACRRLRRFDDWQLISSDLSTILNGGSRHTLYALSELLRDCQHVVNESLLLEFRQSLQEANNNGQCHLIIKNILTYCKNQQLTSVAEKLYHIILDCYSSHEKNVCAVLFSGLSFKSDVIVKGFLQGRPETGEARIEEVYTVYMNRRIFNPPHLQSHIRHWYQVITHIRKWNVVGELLRINAELTRTKPRYYENSHEHRLKMRLASGIGFLILSSAELWNEDLWPALLEQNNQQNVSYMYECVIAHGAPRIDVVIEKLNKVSTYTASQQAAIISVLHCFCMFHPEEIQPPQLQHIIRTLLPLTMGANFQTRTYAQLTILKILKSPDIDATEIKQADQLIAAIEATMGDKLDDLMNDLRMQLPNLCKEQEVSFPQALLHITAAPVDEYIWTREFETDSFKNARDQYAKRSGSGPVTKPKWREEIEMNDELSILQRKMNPTDNILARHNLLTYPEQRKSYQMFVVASLLDKLPNVGGLARTCEVLGINNLVMNCKADLDKNDFKHLSMTAEKTLNIMEVKTTELMDFLLRKQTEGFKIVGAEQTASSISFVDFKFPAKCVLLLGHEKEGLPPNLLDFLDYAVEIPQSGQVRSLNVHVTGALFMWEYYKQHVHGSGP